MHVHKKGHLKNVWLGREAKCLLRSVEKLSSSFLDKKNQYFTSCLVKLTKFLPASFSGFSIEDSETLRTIFPQSFF